MRLATIAISATLFAGSGWGQTISKDAAAHLAQEWREYPGAHRCLDALDLYTHGGAEDRTSNAVDAKKALIDGRPQAADVYLEAADLKILEGLLATAASFKVDKTDKPNTAALFTFATLLLTDLYKIDKRGLSLEVNEEYLRKNPERALFGLLSMVDVRADTEVVAIQKDLDKNSQFPETIAEKWNTAITQSDAQKKSAAAREKLKTSWVDVDSAIQKNLLAAPGSAKRDAETELQAAIATLKQASQDESNAATQKEAADRDAMIANAIYAYISSLWKTDLAIDQLALEPDPNLRHVSLMELLRICYQQDPDRLFGIVKGFYQ